MIPTDYFKCIYWTSAIQFIQFIKFLKLNLHYIILDGFTSPPAHIAEDKVPVVVTVSQWLFDGAETEC